MRLFVILALLATGATGPLAPAVSAADMLEHFSIQDALNTPLAKDKVDPGVKMYFGGKKPLQAYTVLGEVVSNVKTSGFRKDPEAICNYLFANSVEQLQKEARARGADAIVDIESYYKQRIFKNNVQYECAKGFLLAGVAFRGTAVRLKEVSAISGR